MIKISFILLMITSSLFSQNLKSETSTFGVELNPFRPVYSILTNSFSFSGSLNYFNYTYGLEISLPVTYNQHNVTRHEDYNDKQDSYDEINLNTSIHIRKYLSDGIGGLYAGVFARYTYLEGKLQDDYRLAQVHKIGLGTEIGFKIMRIRGSRIYWGMSLGVGKHFGDNNDIFVHNNPTSIMDDREYFIDIEVLKLGYEF